MTPLKEVVARALCHTSAQRFLLTLVITALGLSLYLVLYLTALHSSNPVPLVPDHDNLNGFLVNTPGCKIPDLDPYDHSVKHLIQRAAPMQCNATPALTFTDGNWLRINKTILEMFYPAGLRYCQSQQILRVEGDDNRFQYQRNLTTFHDDIESLAEFVRVVCFATNGDMVYANFHSFILDKPEMEERCERNHAKYLQEEEPKEELNVVLVGVDAVSRLNFMRQMPKTRKYLLQELGAIELKGYNKVADNTLVNLVPMFGGQFLSELSWGDTADPGQVFDQFNFTWREFSRKGYRTLFAEDAPTISIFNYERGGFENPPTDYYLRPFSLALEDHGSIWKNNHHCVLDKLETEVVLDYVSDFVQKFKDDPHWAFAFITRLTHDWLNRAGAADIPYLNFLQTLKLNGNLENTVLVFFSDHGIRFGDIRNTYIGMLEERLPFMYIVLPKWFHEKYPQLSQNLRKNANRLTTPFDIHKLLESLLPFKGELNQVFATQRGIRLFDEIPPERSCEHAGILPHWCTCHSREQIDPTHPNVIEAAKALVDNINNRIPQDTKQCASLTLEQVTDAFGTIANEEVIEHRLHAFKHNPRAHPIAVRPIVEFLLQVRTMPGRGLFEATVRRWESSSEYQVLGDISRINRYGSQSTCVNNPDIKKFCFCV